jgi:hypothetical protein
LVRSQGVDNRQSLKFFSAMLINWMKYLKSTNLSDRKQRLRNFFLGANEEDSEQSEDFQLTPH